MPLSKKNKSIVIIDDDFVVRQTLGLVLKHFAKHRKNNLSIFTCDNGLEGVGYLMVTLPDVIILDTTLPKYSGTEIADFIVSNPRYRSKALKVILVEGSDELAEGFLPFNKSKESFVKDFLWESIDYKSPVKQSKLDRLILHISSKLIRWSDRSDRNIKLTGSVKSPVYKTVLYLKWIVSQIITSLYLIVLYTFLGKWKDDNIEQSKEDLRKYRIRYYPTLATVAIAVMVFAMQASLFTAGGLTIFSTRILDAFADETEPEVVSSEGAIFDTTLIEKEGAVLRLRDLSDNEEASETKTLPISYPQGDELIDAEYSTKAPSIEYTSVSEYSEIEAIYEESSFNTRDSSTSAVVSGVTVGGVPSNGITYQISPDRQVWMYYDGQDWTATLAGYHTSNTVQELNMYIDEYTHQYKKLYFKAFLISDGSTPVAISDISLAITESFFTSESSPTEAPSNIEDIVVDIKTVESEIEPVILNASWFDGKKIISGRIDLPIGLQLSEAEAQRLLVDIYYTPDSDISIPATNKGDLIGSTGVRAVTIGDYTEYSFSFRADAEPGGYVTAEVKYVDAESVTHVSKLAEPRENSTFTVTLTTDLADFSEGDGLCDTDSDPGNGSQCTLRAAIQEANALAGADNIYFAIPGVGSHTIQPLTQLPTVTGAVVIDGVTQNGSSCGSLIDGSTHTLNIMLDGALQTETVDMLVLGGESSSVSGMAIGNSTNPAIRTGDELVISPGNGLSLTGSGGHTVNCNYFGMHTNGSSTARSIKNSIFSNSPNNTITNNLVGASGNNGIFLWSSLNDDIEITGNLIGTDVYGKTDVGMGASGINVWVYDDPAFIENLVISNNLISGMEEDGISMGPAVKNVTITNNIIGLNLDSTAVIGVGDDGIEILASNYDNPMYDINIGLNTIGGAPWYGILVRGYLYNLDISENLIGTNSDGQVFGNSGGIDIRATPGVAGVVNNALIYQNIIANNVEFGVRAATYGFFWEDHGPAQVRISKNSFSNNGLSISLDYPYPTEIISNDGLRDIELPNSGVDYPIIESSTLGSDDLLSLEGFVGVSAGDAYYNGAFIEFYKVSNDSTLTGEIILGDGLDVPHGEGGVYLGSCTVDVDGTFGVITPCNLNVSSVTPEITVGDLVTATSTDVSNNTSEFGANYEITFAEGTIVVNSTEDYSDLSPGDHVCNTGHLNSEGEVECTFRAAIEEANASWGLDNIYFTIPTSDAGFNDGLWTISLQSALPVISEAVVIDAISYSSGFCGSLNTGTVHDLKIQIDGSSQGSGNILQIVGGSSTVKGLIISNSPNDGVNLGLVGGNIVECNYIGTNYQGLTPASNFDGIEINSISDNLISNNLISGNSESAIHIYGSEADDNYIESNLIGVNAMGDSAIPNGSGIYFNNPSSVQATGNVIGGSVAKANLISGNTQKAVHLDGGISDSLISYNIVGIDRDQSSALPNTTGIEVDGYNGVSRSPVNNTIEYNVVSGNLGDGISIYESDSNTVRYNIVGTDSTKTADLGNSIMGIKVHGNAYSTMYNQIQENYVVNNVTGGISVKDGGLIPSYQDKVKFNTISQNITFNNTELGIDLRAYSLGTGVTPNDDALDTTYGNSAEDYPVFTYSDVTGTILDVDGYVGTTAGNTRYDGATIEIFKAFNDGDNDGEVNTGDELSVPHGEASVYLGSCTADADGTFGVISPCTLDIGGITTIDSNDSIVATSTHTNGSTSEFGPNEILATPGVYVVNSTGDDSDNNPGDGICNTGGALPLGSTECTLRAAIEEANATGGAEDINFSIPTSDPGYNGDYWSIKPQTFLPIIIGGVDIDARTQPGSSCSPMDLKIEINGQDQASGAIVGTITHQKSAFHFQTNNFSFRGLVVNNYPSRAVYFDSGSESGTIQCNIIGMDKSGTVDPDSQITGYGFYFYNSASAQGVPSVGSYRYYQIGGGTPEDRNIFSGFSSAIYGYPMRNSFIQGNYFGTDPSGTTYTGLYQSIFLYSNSRSITIGGPNTSGLGGGCTGECNLFANDGQEGIYLGGDASNLNLIQGNFFGTDVTGMNKLSTPSIGANLQMTDDTTVRDNLFSTRLGIRVNGYGTTTLANNNQFINNYIGLATDGITPLPSTSPQQGIRLWNSSPSITENITNTIISSNRIAGAKYGVQVDRAGSGTKITDNTIFNFTTYGVYLYYGARNVEVVDNSIHAAQNRYGLILGQYGNDLILGQYGNDYLDADNSDTSGYGVLGNNGQNFPSLYYTDVVDGDTEVYGKLYSEPNSYYRIDIFTNETGKYYQGKNLRKKINITTDSNGLFDYSVSPIVLDGFVAPVGEETYTLTASKCTDITCTSLIETSPFSAPPRFTSGTIYEDVNGDGNLDDGVGLPGVTVNQILDMNSNYSIDSTDMVFQSTVSAADGSYRLYSDFLPYTSSMWIQVNSSSITPSSSYTGAPVADQTVGPSYSYCDNGNGAYLQRYSEGPCFGGKYASVPDNPNDLGGSEHYAGFSTGSVGVNFGFSFNAVTNTNDDGQGSLRQFMNNANDIDGENISDFSISKSDPNCLSFFNDGVSGTYDHDASEVNCLSANADPDMTWWRIDTVTSDEGNGDVFDLPPTIDAVVDGTTQAGYVPNTSPSPEPFNGKLVVEITCNESICITAPSINGLVVNSRIGLGQLGTQLILVPIVEGSYIGTDISGLRAQVENAALSLNCPYGDCEGGIKLGGTNPEDRNIFIGVGKDLFINYADSSDWLLGNYFGAFKDGTFSEIDYELFYDFSLAIDHDHGLNIGDGTEAGMNLIVGGRVGIGLWCTARTTVINKNLIIGNDIGIASYCSEDVIITNNVITDNVSHGISTNSTSSDILIFKENSIFNNGGLGIDLKRNGVTLNDALDLDTGPNGLQNFPVLERVVRRSDSVIVKGYLETSPNKTFEVELYGNKEADVTGYGEGEVSLTTFVVETNSDGRAEFDLIIPDVSIDETLMYASALATGCGTISIEIGLHQLMSEESVSCITTTGTSEFSANIEIIDAGTLAEISIIEDPIIVEETIKIQLIEPDLNISSTEADTAIVSVLNSQTGELEMVVLTETDLENGIFEGTLITKYLNSGIDEDGQLSIFDGEDVIVNYTDTSTEDGVPVIVSDSAETFIPKAPDANDDFAVTKTSESILIDVVANDRDPNNDLSVESLKLIASSVTNPDAVISVQDSKIKYLPGTTFAGVDSFSYEICDARGLCDQAAVFVNVGKQAPIIEEDTVTVNEDEEITIKVLENDRDSTLVGRVRLDLSTFEISTISQFGLLKVNEMKEVTYTPEANYNGLDSFTYNICDSSNKECGTAKVNITIIPVADNPVANDDIVSITSATNKCLSINVIENDADPDGDLDINSLRNVDNPETGKIVFNKENTRFLYCKSDDSTAKNDSFSYEVCDLEGNCDSAIVSIGLNVSNPRSVTTTNSGEKNNIFGVPEASWAVIGGTSSLVSVVTTGAILTLNMLILGLSLLSLPDYLYHYITNFLSWIGIRKKREPFGVVYDSITKEPISKAVVRIYGDEGKLVETSLSDVYGVFHASIEPGKYSFIAHKSGYSTQSVLVKSGSDGEYARVYRGGLVDVRNDYEIGFSIPIDPIESSFVQRMQAVMKSQMRRGLSILNWSLLIVGIIFALVGVIAYHSALNILILVIYIPTFILVVRNEIVKPIAYAKVVDTAGNFVEGLTIGMKGIGSDWYITKRVTDSNGMYRFVAPKGEYVLEILSKGYSLMSDGTVDTTNKRGGKYSFVGKDMTVLPINDSPSSKPGRTNGK